MDYQKEIYKNDADFYALVLKNISEMPDFRPQETLKQMKKEPQNNWRLLYEELQAINHNEEHLNILHVINEGKKTNLLLYADDKEIIEEFVFCYPGLTWILLIDDCMIALLLPHGIFLSYIEMKKEYIGFLRSFDVVKTLYSQSPSLITLEDLTEEILHGQDSYLTTGYLLWLFSAYPVYEKLLVGLDDVIFQKLCSRVIYSSNIDVVKKFIDIVEKEERTMVFLLRISARCHEDDIACYILSFYEYLPTPFSLLKMAIYNKMVKMVPSILNRISIEDIEGRDDEMLKDIIDNFNEKILRLILESGKIYLRENAINEETYLMKSEYLLDLEITYDGDIENFRIIEILLEYDPHMDLYHIVQNAIKHSRIKILESICHLTNYLKRRNFIEEAVFSGNPEIAKLIIESCEASIKDGEFLVKMALSQENEKMVSYLLTCERITMSCSRGLLKKVREFLKYK